MVPQSHSFSSPATHFLPSHFFPISVAQFAPYPIFHHHLPNRISETFLSILGTSHGEAQLQAVPAKLLHYQGEREAKKEGSSTEQGKPSPTLGAKAYVLQSKCTLTSTRNAYAPRPQHPSPSC